MPDIMYVNEAGNATYFCWCTQTARNSPCTCPTQHTGNTSCVCANRSDGGLKPWPVTYDGPRPETLKLKAVPVVA